MDTENLKHTEIDIRGIQFRLMTYTRSLELCARMNYETENLDFIDGIISGSVLYDLGACEGRFSIYAARKGIRVVSFEPEARNYSVFKQNIALNAIAEERLTAINAGLGAANGTAIMNIGQPWEGGHQKVVEHGEVRNDLDFEFVDSQEIKLVGLDAFIDNGIYPKPDYLKIDIDGSEMPFLSGAKKTLDSPNLKGIIFELSEADPNFETIMSILKAHRFHETQRFAVPNEPALFNIVFSKK